MSKNTRNASKPVKIVLLAVVGLIAVVTVIAVLTTSGARSDAENRLVDGLTAIDAKLGADPGAAIENAKQVCRHKATPTAPTVEAVRSAFAVGDVGIAGRITGVITDSKICAETL